MAYARDEWNRLFYKPEAPHPATKKPNPFTTWSRMVYAGVEPYRFKKTAFGYLIRWLSTNEVEHLDTLPTTLAQRLPS
jgi:hypothetical protein